MASAEWPPFSSDINIVMLHLNELSLQVNGSMHEWHFRRMQTMMDVQTTEHKYETDGQFERKY